VKVGYFCGREHHIQRLQSVVNELESRGVETFPIVSDNSLNIDAASAQLTKLGLPFKHMLDYYAPESTPIVSKMVQQALGQMGTPDFDDDLLAFIEPYWITYSLREAGENLLGFSKLLDMEKPDGILILHENNYYGKLIAYLCRERGIPCVAFQEGLLRQRDQETQNKQSSAADYVSTLFVWSEVSKQAYLKAGVPEDKIVVTGIPHLDPYLKLIQAGQVHKLNVRGAFGFNPNLGLVTLALPQLSRFDGDINQTLTQLSDWCAKNIVQLAIRLHPFESPDTALSLQNSIKNPLVKVIRQGDLPELILASDVVVSQHSTAAVETLALGVPLAEIDLSNVGTLEPLSDYGVAAYIRSGELDKLLKPLNNIIPQVLVPWKVRNLGLLDGRASERIVDRLMA
jgi:UDP-N-acetylglucosamine 2-epimerase